MQSIPLQPSKHTALSAVRSSGAFLTQPARCRPCLQLRSRSQKWGLSLRLLLLSNFLSFPLLPSTSPPLFPLPGHPALFPIPNALWRGGVGAQAPIFKVMLSGLRVSGRVFPPPHPRVCKLFTFISRLERPRDVTNAQAHLVCSKRANAFPSPRRPREQ